MTKRLTGSGLCWAFAAALALVLVLPACGGNGKKGDTTPEPDDDDDVVATGDDDDDVMIPEEKFVEIKHFFDRKSRIVSSCFVDGVEAGEIGKDDTVTITVNMVITKSGKVTKVSTAETSTRSDVFEGCVHEKLESWVITTLPKPLEYSYTFRFDRL